jgi:hypothetical protein
MEPFGRGGQTPKRERYMIHPVLMYDVVVETARADNRKRARQPLMETGARPSDQQAIGLRMIARARRSLGSALVRTGNIMQGSPVHGM